MTVCKRWPSKWLQSHQRLVMQVIPVVILLGCAQPQVEEVEHAPTQAKVQAVPEHTVDTDEVSSASQSVEPSNDHTPQATSDRDNKTAAPAVALGEAEISYEVVQTLPAGISETSGLARRDGLLWTINDSGDQPYIYQLTQGATQIKKRHKIRGASNQDWESLAQDDEYLYVADCGNNSGHRDDFQIYRVPWQQIDEAGSQDYVSGDTLRFSYQAKQGKYQAYEHNYDCEAITKVEHELWLFSKNWADEQSQLYIIDPTQAQQALSVADTVNVQGLVTAADYRPETGYLALLGYSKQRVFGHGFLWVFPVVGGNIDITAGKRFVLPQYAQWEAIVWQDDQTLLLTTETSVLMDASLAKISLIFNSER
ncbi:hypothetical protein [Motilimonas pumila]|uniref:Uncharacterized protein n=1 Tax=Motilimonas pumila TaxID=2303987 RepID=A0A418YHE0_9GAMM|nr:hypothetical protein [Motilimonas pumila]RJG49500.1 hypothetical protein D1Z90_05965 [Motilimonas pumila]